MKKILIIVHHLRIGGGAEKIASQVGTNLKRLGHDVTFLIFYDFKPKYEFEGKLICLNEKLTEDVFTKTYKLFSRTIKISNICKKNKINTTISFLEDSNFSSVLSKTLFRNKSKTIVSVRNNPLKHPKLFQILTKIIYPKADLVVALSRGVKNILKTQFNLKNTKTIYNIQDINRFLDLSKEKITNKEHRIIMGKDYNFITIGRLTEQKAHWNLIRSFKEVVKKNNKVKLIILGKGELEKDLRNLTKKLGLEDKVFFLGVVKNVFPYIKKSDCFVFTSDYEGFGNVLTEVLSQNKPIISTDCDSGPREILCPELNIEEKIKYPHRGKYGVLLKTFDEPNNFSDLKEKPPTKEEKKLTETMFEMMKNKDLQKKYSKGLKRAKDFDKHKIIKEWEDVL